jgi:hypothetical protein
MFRSLFSIIAPVVTLSLLSGCAALSGMVVGSEGWFENERPDLEPTAKTDLACDAAIAFKPVSGDDYRDVEASGCGKTARYKLVKVGPVEKWSKSG